MVLDRYWDRTKYKQYLTWLDVSTSHHTPRQLTSSSKLLLERTQVSAVLSLQASTCLEGSRQIDVSSDRESETADRRSNTGSTLSSTMSSTPGNWTSVGALHLSFTINSQAKTPYITQAKTCYFRPFDIWWQSVRSHLVACGAHILLLVDIWW